MRAAASRALVTCLLGTIAHAASAPDAFAAGSVTVASPDGSSRTVSLSRIGDQDVRNRRYAVRSSAGERSVTVTGFSLQRVLAAADVDPIGWSYAEIGSARLSRDEVETGGDSPPVVYESGGATRFLRPSSGPGDLNGDDQSSGASIAVRLRKGAVLQVKASASKTRVKPGEAVVFAANASRQGSTAGLRYSWQFNDGKNATGRRVTHRFRKPGRYVVAVGVTTARDRRGADALVAVQVGKPKDGPNRTGGGTDSDAGAPDSGAASGARRGSSDGEESGRGERKGNSASARSRAKRRREQPAAGGSRIAGELLTEPRPTPDRPATLRAARSGRPQADDGLSVPTAAWGTLAMLALLSLGVALELREARGYRLP